MIQSLFTTKQNGRGPLVIFVGALLFCIFYLLSPPSHAQSPAVSGGMSSYKLSSGDVISIRVFNEPELSLNKVRLTDAGTVAYPSIGEIKVLGLTTGELGQLITSRLRGRILVNPSVSVDIDEYRPFFVNGMVARPGGYAFQPGLTVRKAISLAGGLQERASLNKIFVIRDGDPRQKPLKVDLNASIGPGDLITVEESFF